MQTLQLIRLNILIKSHLKYCNNNELPEQGVQCTSFSTVLHLLQKIPIKYCTVSGCNGTKYKKKSVYWALILLHVIVYLYDSDHTDILCHHTKASLAVSNTKRNYFQVREEMSTVGPEWIQRERMTIMGREQRRTGCHRELRIVTREQTDSWER